MVGESPLVLLKLIRLVQEIIILYFVGGSLRLEPWELIFSDASAP